MRPHSAAQLSRNSLGPRKSALTSKRPAVRGTHALYDPDKARAEAIEHFASHLRVGQDIVRSASNLLLRSFKSSPTVGVVETVVLGHFYRSLIVAADGCLLCLEAGAAEQAFVHSRKALECGLQLQWILAEDIDSRARRFYVWHLREERTWYLRAVPGTEENKDQVAAWNAEKDSGPALDAVSAQSAIDRTNETLSLPGFRETDAWFSEARAKRGLHRECTWHSVGPKAVANLSAMSKALGRYSEYRTTYRNFSYAVHSSSLSSSVRIRNAQLRLEQVRFPRHFSLAFIHTFSELAMRSIDIAERYRREEVEDWKSRARNDWYGVLTQVVNVVTPDQGPGES